MIERVLIVCLQAVRWSKSILNLTIINIDLPYQLEFRLLDDDACVVRFHLIKAILVSCVKNTQIIINTKINWTKCQYSTRIFYFNNSLIFFFSWHISSIVQYFYSSVILTWIQIEYDIISFSCLFNFFLLLLSVLFSRGLQFCFDSNWLFVCLFLNLNLSFVFNSLWSYLKFLNSTDDIVYQRTTFLFCLNWFCLFEN